jgi:hypothetical protein
MAKRIDREALREKLISSAEIMLDDPATPATARLAAMRLVSELAGLLTVRGRGDAIDDVPEDLGDLVTADISGLAKHIDDIKKKIAALEVSE